MTFGFRTVLVFSFFLKSFIIFLGLFFLFIYLLFNFILLYNTVLVLPYIDMNLPRGYMSSIHFGVREFIISSFFPPHFSCTSVRLVSIIVIYYAFSYIFKQLIMANIFQFYYWKNLALLILSINTICFFSLLLLFLIFIFFLLLFGSCELWVLTLRSTKWLIFIY